MAREDRPAGHLAQAWVYPVKSMRGQALDEAVIGVTGIVGDRAWSVCDVVSGQALSARRSPGLAAVSARIGADSVVALDIPGEPEGLHGEAADAALSRHLGRAVHLVRAETGTFADVAPVHLVSAAAVAAAVASGRSCGPGSPDDPRANLIVAIDAADRDDEGPERGWIGQEIEVGTAVLRISRTPKHCLGVYADVLLPGAAATGAAVELR
jgi:uncharacterized protein YcbX